MNARLRDRLTGLMIIFQLAVLAASTLPFKPQANTNLSLLSSITGNANTPPFAFNQIIMAQLSENWGSQITNVLCWFIIAFIVFSLILAIINFCVLFDRRNATLRKFRDLVSYVYLGLAIFTFSTVTIWLISTWVLYGFDIVYYYGLSLLSLSGLAFALMSIIIVNIVNNKKVHVQQKMRVDNIQKSNA